MPNKLHYEPLDTTSLILNTGDWIKTCGVLKSVVDNKYRDLGVIYGPDKRTIYKASLQLDYLD